MTHTKERNMRRRGLITRTPLNPSQTYETRIVIKMFVSSTAPKHFHHTHVDFPGKTLDDRLSYHSFELCDRDKFEIPGQYLVN